MKKKWITLVVLALITVAAGLMFYRSQPAEASNTLITAPVTRGNVVETVQATGTLEAVTTVQVGDVVVVPFQISCGGCREWAGDRGRAGVALLPRAEPIGRPLASPCNPQRARPS